MSLDNLIEYNNNHAKTSEDLWQYRENDPNANMADSETFNLKAKITGKTRFEQGIQNIFFPEAGIKDYNVMNDGQNVFDHPVRTGWLLATDYLHQYLYFKKN